jgi:DNA-binding MarR family transcriptional regulator
MEAAGLVTRGRDEADARVIRIALTQQGQNLRVRLPALLDDIAHQALHGLTPAERAQLVDLLGRVADNMTNPALWAPTTAAGS